MPAVAAVVEAKPRRMLEVGCGWGELARVDRAGDRGRGRRDRPLAAHGRARARAGRRCARRRRPARCRSRTEPSTSPSPRGCSTTCPSSTAAVAELARVLRAGGTLVAVTNSAFPPARAARARRERPVDRARSRARTARRSCRAASPTCGGWTSTARSRVRRSRAAVEEYVRASISMSPFVEQPAARGRPEPFTVRRANVDLRGEEGAVTPFGRAQRRAGAVRDESTISGLGKALWANIEGENAQAVLWRVLSSLAAAAACSRSEAGRASSPSGYSASSARAVAFVDQSERMVELARARGVTDAQVGDVQQLPFADASFDTAVAAWMLYHVPDLDRGPRRARARARAGRQAHRRHELRAAPRRARRSLRSRHAWLRGCSSTPRTARRSCAATSPTSRAPTQRSSRPLSDLETLDRLPPTRSRTTREPCPTTSRCRFASTAERPIFVATTMIRPAELIQRKRDGEELRRRGDLRARPRLRARRGPRLPDGRVLHGRVLPRALDRARRSRSPTR